MGEAVDLVGQEESGQPGQSLPLLYQPSPSSLPLFRYRSPSGLWGMPAGPTLGNTALPLLQYLPCTAGGSSSARGDPGFWLSSCGPGGAGVQVGLQSCPSDPAALGPGMTFHTP